MPELTQDIKLPGFYWINLPDGARGVGWISLEYISFDYNNEPFYMDSSEDPVYFPESSWFYGPIEPPKELLDKNHA